MLVKELIEELQSMTPDLPVYVRAGESGVTDVRGVAPVRVYRDTRTEWYYGTHELESEYDDLTRDKTPTPGVWIR